MNNSPLVSVIVPCFNSGRYISDALTSLESQTYRYLDIIVVNDGSTDDSLRIMDQHAKNDTRIRVLTQPNQGLSCARNAGIRSARGEFVSFLDADDVFLPRKTSEQVQFLQANPAVDLVYSDYLVGDGDLQLTGLVAVRIQGHNLIDAYTRRNWFAPMVPLLRRNLITTVGEFDESLRASEDWDYWIRCAGAGMFGYLHGVVAIYRTHPAQMHNDRSRMFAAGMRVIDKHFRSDSPRYHRALAFFYDAHARYAWADQDRLRAVRYVILSAYHNRSAGDVRSACHLDLAPPDKIWTVSSKCAAISEEFKPYETKWN